ASSEDQDAPEEGQISLNGGGGNPGGPGPLSGPCSGVPLETIMLVVVVVATALSLFHEHVYYGSSGYARYDAMMYGGSPYMNGSPYAAMYAAAANGSPTAVHPVSVHPGGSARDLSIPNYLVKRELTPPSSANNPSSSNNPQDLNRMISMYLPGQGGPAGGGGGGSSEESSRLQSMYAAGHYSAAAAAISSMANHHHAATATHHHPSHHANNPPSSTSPHPSSLIQQPSNAAAAANSGSQQPLPNSNSSSQLTHM
ncbi:Hypothetical protein FKW44_007056, partial [Caligus rogercresseyi]